MTTEFLIKRIRRFLDQVPNAAESVETPSTVVGSLSTNFGDTDLISRINKGVRAIVSNAKAQHVPQAIAEATTISAVETDAIRLLPSRVFVSGAGQNNFVRAHRRSVNSQRRLESRVSLPGREGTLDYPVYVYEDGFFRIFPEGADLRAYVVQMPGEVSAKPDVLPVDRRFQRALVYYVVSSCHKTLQNPDMSEFYQTSFGQEIRPYLLKTRHGFRNDQEVDVE